MTLSRDGWANTLHVMARNLDQEEITREEAMAELLRLLAIEDDVRRPVPEVEPEELEEPRDPL